MPCSLAARRRGQRCWKTPYALRLLLWQLRRADALLYPGAFCTSEKHVAFVHRNGELCEGFVVLCMSHPPAAAAAKADHNESPWEITGVLLGGEQVPGYGGRNQEQA